MVNTQFWSDPYILDGLNSAGKLLYMYLLTNDRANLAGVYEITLTKIAFETGLPRDAIEQHLARFEKDGKIKYQNGWIAIKKFTKHQALNPKIVLGILCELEKAPEWVFEWVQLDEKIDFEGHKSELKNRLSNLIQFNSIKEERDKDSKEIQEIYDYFIKRFSKNPNQYKLTDVRKVKIKARLKDAGKEMLKQAIKNTSQSKFHRGDNGTGWQADLDFIIRSYEQVERLSNLAQDTKQEEFNLLGGNNNAK